MSLESAGFQSAFELEPLLRQRDMVLDANGEQQFQDLLQALPAAVYTTDAEGRITYYNEAAATLWGCRPKLGSDEWCGSWRLFWPDGTPLPHDQCPMAVAVKEKRPVRGAEAVAERPDGTRVPFIPFPTPLYDASGAFIGAVNMLLDITERKQAEEKIRRAEHDLRDFVENATVGLHWVGSDGSILWANRNEMEMLGFSAEEYIGHHIAEFHADKPVIEDILMRLTQGETLNNYEARLRCKDGSVRHVLISSNALWEDGKFVHTQCFTRDITELKRAEAQTREHEKQRSLDLADIRRLQDISSRLVFEDNVDALYEGILDAAIGLMRSDMATMQMFDPVRGGLRLLGGRGFDAASLGAFEWVGPASGTTCAGALSTGSRVIIPDVDLCDSIVGTPVHAALRKCGIRAAQSTPLVARDGSVTGMITTHWREPHQPTERELLLIDVLARQAADLIERKQKEDKIIILAREAEHRAKNVLATVQATVHLTQSDTAEGVKRAIEGRIQALANVHRLFADSRWTGAELQSLVREELLPYCQDGEKRVRIDGPTLLLEPDIAQTIAVTLHELATNAAKYGALSVRTGHIQVEWSRAADGRLILRWTEADGPRVGAPKHRGFGTRVMASMIQDQLKGEARFDWRADGLVCEIAIPV